VVHTASGRLPYKDEDPEEEEESSRKHKKALIAVVIADVARKRAVSTRLDQRARLL